MSDYKTIAQDAVIESTMQALQDNGFKTLVANSADAAKQAVLAALPAEAEVLTVTSKTLEALGLDKAINESGTYDAVKPKLMAMMGDESKKRERRKLGTSPDYVVGSVHAVTQDGRVIIASATGSQLASYVYGAEQVIWVVGAQKIVPDIAAAQERLEGYVFPLENERAQQAYGSGSTIAKELIYNKEVQGRVTIVLVKEALGF